MGRIRRFLAWPATEKWLLAKSWVLLGAIRLSLFTLRYERTHRWLTRHHGEPDRRHSRERPSAARIARLVELASHFVPGGSHCLTRALVAEFLLARRGYQIELTIGVAKDKQDRLIAHAWIQHGGAILIGDSPELSQYTALRNRGAPHAER